MKENIEATNQRIKIILLGSGYNGLQEGKPRAFRIMSDEELWKFCLNPLINDKDKLCGYKYSNNGFIKEFIYVGVNQLNSIVGYASYTKMNNMINFGRFKVSDLGLEKKGKSLAVPFAETIKNSDFQKLILNLIAEAGHLDSNPFIEEAITAGYEVDVESIDCKTVPCIDTESTDCAYISSSDYLSLQARRIYYNQLTRTQANLRPEDKNTQDKQKLNSLISKWREEAHLYSGMVFINADGDGLLDKTYSLLYLEFETSNNFYFADWCTCCTVPTKTKHYISSNPDEYSYLINNQIFRRAPFQRAFNNRYEISLKQDYTNWLGSLKSAEKENMTLKVSHKLGVFCQPCKKQNNTSYFASNDLKKAQI